MGTLLICCLFFAGCGQTSEEDNEVAWDAVPHFMVNGKVYWVSSHPCGNMPESFQYAGDIQEAIYKTPTSDWQSYDNPVGSKVYLDPDIPYQAWIDSRYRYATSEAKRSYLMHNGDLYVYVGSIHGYDGDCYSAIVDAWNPVVEHKKLPHDSVYLGKSVFDGYDVFPQQELGSNSFSDAHSIYQYSKDNDVLFATTDNESSRVYVKDPMPPVE